MKSQTTENLKTIHLVLKVPSILMRRAKLPHMMQKLKKAVSMHILLLQEHQAQFQATLTLNTLQKTEML